MTQSLLPQLEAAEGCVVNLSSIAATTVMHGIGAYCTAKAAVDQLTRAMALEFASRKVRVNAIRPATVATNFHRAAGMDEAALERYYGEGGAAVHPLGRVGRPDDIVQAVLYFVDATWATGSLLTVDGGRTLLSAVAPGMAPKKE